MSPFCVDVIYGSSLASPKDNAVGGSVRFKAVGKTTNSPPGWLELQESGYPDECKRPNRS